MYPISKSRSFFDLETLPNIRKASRFLSALGRNSTIYDPLAAYHKMYFFDTKFVLARSLYRIFNKYVFGGALPDDMEISWNLNFYEPVAGLNNLRSTHLILSAERITSPEQLRDALFHQMAYLGCIQLYSYSNNRGPRWFYYVMQAKFPDLPRMTEECHFPIFVKRTYTCKNCKKQFDSAMGRGSLKKYACRNCGSSFENSLRLYVKKRRLGRKRRMNCFNQFVKVYYRSVKSEFPTYSHARIMQYLGKKYVLREQYQ